MDPKKIKCQSGPDEETVVRKLDCILSNDITAGTLPTVDVYTGVISDRSKTSSVIIGLNAKYPIYSLQHLKRVNGSKILLSIALDDDCAPPSLSQLGISIDGLNETVERFSVAAVPPKTRQQFNFANGLWPCNFHEDKYLEKLLSGNIFSAKDLEEHEKWMGAAVEAARRSRKYKVGAAVVDPVAKKLVAVASDSRDEHPMKHAVMATIDLVSHSQGGGCWNKLPLDFFYSCNNRKEVKDHDDPYLCTGYYVYTTCEPCIMCGMALVHSRALKVFYGIPCKYGSLGSACKLHCLRELNHHFEVYSGLLKQECAELSDSG